MENSRFLDSIDAPLYKVYDFELIDLEWWRDWFRVNWSSSFHVCGIYLVLVFLGQWIMKGREPFKLRKPLALWNFGLAVFSIMGMVRSAPEFFHTLSKPNGIYNLVCMRETEPSATAFWYILFNLSKPAELGDTAFIVLRKQKLLFIHWYHHISVFILNWYIVSFYAPLTRLFTMMNYTVHAFMYSYYFLKSLQVKLPIQVSISITAMQLVQMFLGLTSTMFLHWNIVKGSKCDTELSEALMGYVVYGPYVILFSHFFITAYFGSSKGKSTQIKKQK